jgi:hypothetical protein
MRTIRALTAALAFVAAVPAVGTAQLGRPFTNSWFWGAKGGGMDYNSLTKSHRQAPLLGGDWLITRTHGGLYVSFTQAMLTDLALVQLDPADTNTKSSVELKDMRRVDLAAMAFVGNSTYWHPYVGAGFSLKQIATANIQSASPDGQTIAFVTALRTGAAPYFIAGAQLKLTLFNFFFQGTASPANKNMFLYNGKAFHLTYEAGLRYNVGSAIDKL